MDFIFNDEAQSVEVVKAIHTGDVLLLKRQLAENPGLAKTRIIGRDYDNKCNNLGMSRTLLHVVTDWPGHFPNGTTTVNVLIDAGADVNARFTGPHTETPLHWAASSDDIEVLDALLDAGADIEAPGAVIAGGTPLDDAVAFGQWQAAHRLVERGAQIALWHAAALGYMDAIEAYFSGSTLSERYPWGAKCTSCQDKVNVAFWCACHGGQTNAADYLLDQGADLNWISDWDGLTPLDAAQRSASTPLVKWLLSQGSKSSNELK
ncbi:ankyrin repeat domain-containing protein [Metabacillus schmidteae]|uniref:ankyrin repeat domain-containing protein n=1 Tax=Metabacillus schmidteae TaxID=2730405 RepID=UPI001589EB98|nr:ankyrin repeat domain-containing protein [Metabacillus schmidteae]